MSGACASIACSAAMPSCATSTMRSCGQSAAELLAQLLGEERLVLGNDRRRRRGAAQVTVHHGAGRRWCRRARRRVARTSSDALSPKSAYSDSRTPGADRRRRRGRRGDENDDRRLVALRSRRARAARRASASLGRRCVERALQQRQQDAGGKRQALEIGRHVDVEPAFAAGHERGDADARGGDLELAREHRRRAVDVRQGGAQEHDQLVEQRLGTRRVAPVERLDRIEDVEEELRIDARLDRAQLRVDDRPARAQLRLLHVGEPARRGVVARPALALPDQIERDQRRDPGGDREAPAVVRSQCRRPRRSGR